MTIPSVPSLLTQQFIGVKGKKPGVVATEMNQICYDKMTQFVGGGHQVMIFVHSRNETTKTARNMSTMAMENHATSLFVPAQPSREYERIRKEVQTSRNSDVKNYSQKDLVFITGMLRSDRFNDRKTFMEGHIKVLICTATLAWGVNLPAHAVIIKGNASLRF